MGFKGGLLALNHILSQINISAMYEYLGTSGSYTNLLQTRSWSADSRIMSSWSCPSSHRLPDEIDCADAMSECIDLDVALLHGDVLDADGMTLF